MSRDEILGHTRDGEQVCIRVMDSLFDDTIYTVLEIGRHTFQLDHSDPELIPALRRSLHPLPRAVA